LTPQVTYVMMSDKTKVPHSRAQKILCYRLCEVIGPSVAVWHHCAATRIAPQPMWA